MNSVAAKRGESCGAELCQMVMAWGFLAVLPLPVLIAIEPAKSAMVACVFLGLAGALLVAEFNRTLGQPASLGAWWVRTKAIAIALVANVALFVVAADAAGVESLLPFPLMSLLAVVPAAGITPWMLRRVGDPYASIVFGSALVFVAKLAGCVVARCVYGPDYVEQGHVAADWQTAPLMISIFWTLTVLVSLGLLVADYLNSQRSILPSPSASDVGNPDCKTHSIHQ